ncbi:MAG: hypothetical protein EBX50_17005 [Chitinophagia bacterium]|nr:hypothetical protein [Chitinophagia bacterium]
MKKQNLLLLAAAGAAAYFLFKRKGTGAGFMMAPTAGQPGETDKTDAVIDADKAKISIPDAIEAVKAVSEKIKDLKVEIKKGGETTTVRTGKKQKAGAGRKVKKTKTRVKGSKAKRQKTAKVAANVATQAAMQAAGLPPFAPQVQQPFPFFK